VPTHSSTCSSVSTGLSCKCYPLSGKDRFTTLALPCSVSSKLPKKIQEKKKKIVKVFARFSENVLYFCRPHPTSAVGANFCGCIYFDPCSVKNIKNSEK
jgi:hypothetical protein